MRQQFFGVGERAGKWWAADGPPDAVAKFLGLMDALELTADRVRRLLWRDRPLSTAILRFPNGRHAYPTSAGELDPNHHLHTSREPANRLRIPSATQQWLDLLFLSLSLERGMPLAEVAGFLGQNEDEVREKAEELSHPAYRPFR